MGKERGFCFHLECYSCLVIQGSVVDVNAEDLMKMCSFEYGIDVTPEVYKCIRADRLRMDPDDTKGITKFFYFKKSIRRI